MAFYLGVTMLAGTYFRRGLIYFSNFVFINDIPRPEPIMNLIDCIYLMRLEGNLKR
jgi:hypothetical protein